MIDNRCGVELTPEEFKKASRARRNCNCGNLKYANQPGTIGKDKQGFAIFYSYEKGFGALVRQIEIAVTGKSKVYKPTMSILEFFSVYAPSADHNDPIAYAKFVANKIGVPIETKIKDLA